MPAIIGLGHQRDRRHRRQQARPSSSAITQASSYPRRCRR
jgi:hypothetical protein